MSPPTPLPAEVLSDQLQRLELNPAAPSDLPVVLHATAAAGGLSSLYEAKAQTHRQLLFRHFGYHAGARWPPTIMLPSRASVFSPALPLNNRRLRQPQCTSTAPTLSWPFHHAPAREVWLRSAAAYSDDPTGAQFHVKQVIDGVDFQFKGNDAFEDASNHRVDDTVARQLWVAVLEDVQAKRAILFPACPHPAPWGGGLQGRYSPCFAIPKSKHDPDDPRIRECINASFGKPLSFNDLIVPVRVLHAWLQLRDLLHSIQFLGVGTLVVAADFRKGYKQLFLAPGELHNHLRRTRYVPSPDADARAEEEEILRRFLGCDWRDHVDDITVQALTVLFGCRESVFRFIFAHALIANVIEHQLEGEQHLSGADLAALYRFYVDNWFLLVPPLLRGRPDTGRKEKLKTMVLSTFSEHAVDLHEHQDGLTFEALGFACATSPAITAAIKPKRRMYSLAALAKLRDTEVASLHALLSATGIAYACLAAFSEVVPSAHRVWALVKQHSTIANRARRSRRVQKVRLPEAVRWTFDLWFRLLRASTAASIFHADDAPATVFVRADASPFSGAGASELHHGQVRLAAFSWSAAARRGLGSDLAVPAPLGGSAPLNGCAEALNYASLGPAFSSQREWSGKVVEIQGDAKGVIGGFVEGYSDNPVIRRCVRDALVHGRQHDYVLRFVAVGREVLDFEDALGKGEQGRIAAAWAQWRGVQPLPPRIAGGAAYADGVVSDRGLSRSLYPQRS